jgi:hypothetical protein
MEETIAKKVCRICFKELTKEQMSRKCNYCSQLCWKTFIKNKADEKWKRTCPVCNKEFVISYKNRSNYRNNPNNRQFCGKLCWLNFLKQRSQKPVESNIINN